MIISFTFNLVQIKMSRFHSNETERKSIFKYINRKYLLIIISYIIINEILKNKVFLNFTFLVVVYTSLGNIHSMLKMF